jgi:hypothetical protein
LTQELLADEKHLSHGVGLVSCGCSALQQPRDLAVKAVPDRLEGVAL